MNPTLQLGQQVRILGLGGRLVNLGRIVAETHNNWVVLPDACSRVSFAKRTRIMQPNLHREKWPKIAP